MSAIWIVIGSLAAFAVVYRFYTAFLAAKVAMLNDERSTPAHRLKDGHDYQPTNRWVLFGHHFAAIAGPGPLIGPVLAAQWGYLPGLIWIVIGCCFAGAAHDFVILWASVREDGKSLSQIARSAISPTSGLISSIAVLFIIICLLAGVAVTVVNALAESPWGMFTIMVSIPAALLTGLWMYRIRPGKVGEASLVGMAILSFGVIAGHWVQESALAPYLTFDKETLRLALPAYAFVASVLPVWVLMCPRDYLSSYMKAGVMILLGAGLILANPTLKMPATTPFMSGGSPVIGGSVWPFVCITIMCGAVSGFHALIASGTTPKMINKESDIRMVSSGAMLLEGFVAVTALLAAACLDPGDYFAINADQSKPATQAAYVTAVQTMQEQHGWDIAPKGVEQLATDVGEKSLVGRTGGAVTLAVGMASIFNKLPIVGGLMSYWYHFVIMFEALFILTLLETGTRVARFVFQEFLQQLKPKQEEAREVSYRGVVLFSLITTGAWGWMLYTATIDTIWRMMGIANQLLAGIALAVGTTYILMHARKKIYALVTLIPFAFVLATIFTAGFMQSSDWWGKAALGGPDAFKFQLQSILTVALLALTSFIALDAARRWWQLAMEDKTPREPLLKET